MFKNIDKEEALKIIAQEDVVVLDVRTPAEFCEKHYPGAINIDFYDDNFEEELNKLDKSKTYIIHCRSGGRSSKSMQLMQELGFTRVYNVVGSFI